MLILYWINTTHTALIGKQSHKSATRDSARDGWTRLGECGQGIHACGWWYGISAGIEIRDYTTLVLGMD